MTNKCSELFNFIQHDSRNDKLAGHIYRALTSILDYIIGNLEKWESVGRDLVKKILQSGMNQIYAILGSNVDILMVSATLKLLASMATVDPKAVIVTFNFNHEAIQRIMTWKPAKKPLYLRKFFMNFILAFLIVGDKHVVQQICSMKNFLNSFFNGLNKDHAKVIVKFLVTLKVKVLENLSAVSKTLKIRLINEATLTHVIDLLDWTGPFRKVNRSFDKSKKLDPSLIVPATTEEIKEVQKVSLDFLRTACSSFKYGIIFREVSQKDSAKGFKNANHVITNLLKNVKSPLESKAKLRFLVDVLSACQEQRRFFLNQLKSSFSPRLSPTWIRAMHFLIALVKNYKVQENLFKEMNKTNVHRTVSDVLGLNLFSQDQLIDALKSNHSLVRLKTLEWISSVLVVYEEVSVAQQAFLRDKQSSRRENMEFKYRLFDTFKRVLPPLEIVSSCVSAEFESLDLQVPDDQKASLSSYLMTATSVQFSYVSLFPQQILPEDFLVEELLAKLDSLEQLTAQAKGDICMNLLKLLTIADPSGKMFHEKNKSKNPIYLLLRTYLDKPDQTEKNKVLDLLQSLLKKQGILVDSLNLDLWMSNMSENVLQLIWRALVILLERFNEFHDQVIESQLTLKTNFKKKGLSNMSFKDLCTFYNKESAQFTKEGQNLHFKQQTSAFIPAVLQALNSVEEEFKDGCKEYVEDVLFQVLHSSEDPRSLCNLLKKHLKQSTGFFKDYFSLWIKNKSSLSSVDYEEEIRMTGPGRELLIGFMKMQHNRNKKPKFHCIEIEMKSVSSLVPQIMLYINFELCKILSGDLEDPRGAESLIRLLKKLTCPDSTEENESDDATVVEKILQEVFAYELSVRWFLWMEELRIEKSDLVEMMRENWTNTLLLCLDRYVLRRKEFHHLVPFKEKTLRYIGHLCSEGLKDEKNWTQISECLKTLKPLLNSGDCVSTINLISVSFKSKQLFEHISKSSFILLQQLTVQGQCDQLTAESISSLFQTVWITSDGELIHKVSNKMADSFQQLLQMNPAYCLSVPIDLSLKLLEESNTKSCEMLHYLSRHSPAHRTALRNQLLENRELIDRLPPISLIQILTTAVTNDNEEMMSVIAGPLLNAVDKLVNSPAVYESDSEMTPDHGLEGMIVIVLEKEFIEQKSVRKLVDRCLTMHKTGFPTPVQFGTMIQLFKGIQKAGKTKLKGHVDALSVICKLFLGWLPELLLNEKPYHEYFNQMRNIFNELTWESLISVTDVIDCSSVFTLLVEHCLKDECKVIGLLSCLCKKIFNPENPTRLESPKSTKVLKLIFSHPNFEEIMENKNDSFQILKYDLIDLLIILTLFDGSFCNADHVPILLSSYNATMDATDQRILYLLGLYESNKVKISKFRPFHWGQSASLHYGDSRAPAYLWKESNMDDIIRALDEDQLTLTIENFPLELPLKPERPPSGDDRKDKFGGAEIYDIRFLFPIFISLLDQGCLVDCHYFIKSQCLSLAIASLSSLDVDTRSAGYTILYRFTQHLEGSRFPDKQLFLQFLQSLRNALPKENVRIASLVTWFIVRCIQVVGKPGEQMYSVLCNYLVSNESLQIGYVPEFNKLFDSRHHTLHNLHKSFILNVLQVGFRSSLDFHLCQKSYIFNSILNFISSSSATREHSEQCMNFLIKALTIRPAAYSLYRDQSFLTWISSEINRNGSEWFLIQSVNALSNLWVTSIQTNRKPVEEHSNDKTEIMDDDEGEGQLSVEVKAPLLNERKKHPFNAAFPLEFLVVHLKLLAKLSNFEDLHTLEAFLKTLGDALEFHTRYESTASSILSVDHIKVLVELMTKLLISSTNEINEVASTGPHRPAKRTLSAAVRVTLFWLPRTNLETTEGAEFLKSVIVKVLSSCGDLCANAARWLRHLSEFETVKTNLAEDQSKIVPRLLIPKLCRAYDERASRSIIDDCSTALTNFGLAPLTWTHTSLVENNS